MMSRLDKNGNSPRYDSPGVERFELNGKCSDQYRAGMNRLLDVQREEVGRLEPTPGMPAVKDGWHPGEVLLLTEDSWQLLRSWVYDRQDKVRLEPRRRECA